MACSMSKRQCMISGLICTHEPVIVIADKINHLNKKKGFMTWQRMINILSPGGETSLRNACLEGLALLWHMARGLVAVLNRKDESNKSPR